jgi:hypothetical protein
MKTYMHREETQKRASSLPVSCRNFIILRAARFFTRRSLHVCPSYIFYDTTLRPFLVFFCRAK